MSDVVELSVNYCSVCSGLSHWFNLISADSSSLINCCFRPSFLITRFVQEWQGKITFVAIGTRTSTGTTGGWRKPYHRLSVNIIRVVPGCDWQEYFSTQNSFRIADSTYINFFHHLSPLHSSFRLSGNWYATKCGGWQNISIIGDRRSVRIK